MSYYSVFLGPYLQATLMEKVVTKHNHYCNNKECQRYEKRSYSEVFCPKCGAKIEAVPFETTEYCAANANESDDDFDFWEGINDYLCDPFWENDKEESSIYIPNRAMSGVDRRLNFELSQEAPDPTDFNGDTIEAEKAAFTKTFASQIKKLEGLFGKENLQLKWGQFCW